MSYCRFSESDMYIYSHVAGGIICQVCSLMPLQKTTSMFFNGEFKMHGDFWAYSTQEMIDHVRQHELAGDDFPIRIYERLREDDKENFPEGEDNEQRKK
jgi:hypothetical protein